MGTPRSFHNLIAALLLALMAFLAGGSALRESATIDEVAHIGAGLSYLQRFDLRLNPEHPPLPKLLAAIPLVIRGASADYASNAWQAADSFIPAYAAEWPFGDAVLGRWNPWKPTLLWARLPMLLLTLLLGFAIYIYAKCLAGPWGGLLCLAFYVTTPAFLVFGPLVITDLPVSLFSLIALWQFGEIWTSPSPRNSLLFGLALAASLLSKFTGLLLFPVVFIFFVQTRFWPTSAEPAGKLERKMWRRSRWRSVLRGVLWAALFVYVCYFVFSFNQSNEALNRIGSGPWAGLIRRPLMPPWLYLRGLLLMLNQASRPTFILGQAYPHGVPFYFPLAFALKSTLGFLLILLLACVLAIFSRTSRSPRAPVIQTPFQPHWRVIIVAFYVFLGVCLLSRLNMSIRHFMIPIVLLIMLLAPLPALIQPLPARRPLQLLTAVLALSSFVSCISVYPYFFPFTNSLARNRPVYTLLNDSNVSWNEALPAVADFAAQHRLSRLPLDWASLSDPALVVPQAEVWDCQLPSSNYAGQWVVVAAVSILENRNCGYLRNYPQQVLAGGSMYAFQLPQPIPQPGAPDGPPLPADRKQMWGSPFDLRGFTLNIERHPDQLPAALDGMMRAYQQRRAPAP